MLFFFIAKFKHLNSSIYRHFEGNIIFLGKYKCYVLGLYVLNLQYIEHACIVFAMHVSICQ